MFKKKKEKKKEKLTWALSSDELFKQWKSQNIYI